MSRILAASIILAAGFAAAPALASTYHQSFDYLGPTQDEALRNLGWCGGNAGDAFCNNPPGTAANNGGEGAVSVGAGFDGNQGFAFWSQTAINADAFLYTNAFGFSTQAGGTRMSWHQSDSDPVGARIALLSGTTWYISHEVFSHVRSEEGDWGGMSAVLEELAYFSRDASADPSSLPGGGVGVDSLFLADGTAIDAFGFWWDGPKSATSRVDELSLAPVPLSASLPLLIAAIGALGLARRPGRTT